jgi:hypothetical protein
MSITPPEVTIPAVPEGFVAVSLKNYRGYYPKAAQTVAIPDAVQELESSTSYEDVFGGAVVSATKLAGDLNNLMGWSALRIRLEAYLEYVQSNEAIASKAAMVELDQLADVYNAINKANPAALAAFPATGRLLDVPKVAGARAAATRARNAKASASAQGQTTATAPAATTAAPAPATGAAAAAAPVVNPVTGGATTK